MVTAKGVSLKPRSYVALDLETTGLNPDRDEIIEIAAVRFSRGQVEAEFQTLVRPSVDLPLRVTQLTGIETSHLTEAPTIDEVCDAVSAFVGDSIVVGHSVGFDLRFVRRHGLLRENGSIDTFELAGILVPEARRYGVGHLLDHLSLTGSGLHRALADAHAHRRLFEALLERAEELDHDTLQAIDRLAAGSGWSLAGVFAAALQGKSRNGELPAVDIDLTPLPPPLHVAPEPVQIDSHALEAHISPGGRLSKLLDGWEDRPGQREMLRRVVEAFNEEGHLLVEAGTGTGKSLGYLLPAAAWSVANGMPVVVATHTIALQHQLVEKDLPLARQILGTGLQGTVLKGRSHYLCRSRLASLSRRTNLSPVEVSAAAKILVWARQTTTGDRSELLLQPEEHAVWRRVNAEGDACAPGRCPYARRRECWVQRARTRAERSHIVVVNHALLISDMLIGSRLLPEHRALVIDEAHHLEDVATSALGFSCSERLFTGLVSDLIKGEDALLKRVVAAVNLTGLPDDTKTSIAAAATDLGEIAHNADPLGAELFARVSTFLKEQAPGGEADVRLTPATRSNPGWFDVETGWDPLRADMKHLGERLDRLSTAIAAVGDELLDPGLPADLAAAAREARSVFSGLDRILSRPRSDDITWAHRGGAERLGLHRAPLQVGDTLSRRLFADKATLILTSATLRAGDEFDLIRTSLGATEADEAVVPSPFDYGAAALLCIPSDIPEPSEPEHSRAVEELLIDLCHSVKGRTLVLYTSHSDLRAGYHAIRGPLGDLGICVLGQGLDGSRHNLLEGFRDPETRTVLMGTRSFWEGIDVPGEPLSCVVIARLPFDVPTNPIFAARSEMFEDPFYEYAVPQAILRFRQGFGRLIRSMDDRGVVVVLDRRILTKAYGQLFLDALPPVRRRIAPTRTIAAVAARFLDGEEIADPADVALPDGWYNEPHYPGRDGDGGDRLPTSHHWRAIDD